MKLIAVQRGSCSGSSIDQRHRRRQIVGGVGCMIAQRVRGRKEESPEGVLAAAGEVDLPAFTLANALG